MTAAPALVGLMIVGDFVWTRRRNARLARRRQAYEEHVRHVQDRWREAIRE